MERRDLKTWKLIAQISQLGGLGVIGVAVVGGAVIEVLILHSPSIGINPVSSVLMWIGAGSFCLGTVMRAGISAITTHGEQQARGKNIP